MVRTEIMKVINPNTLLLDNALATMGAGLPSAMLAKLIHPASQSDFG